MANDQVTLIGNLTRDPELRFTPTGRAVTQLGIAVNRRFQVNQEWKETTSFFDIIAWGELGENVAASLEKGMRVIVCGRLEQRSWETDEGDKRSKVEVIADSVGPELRWATCKVLRSDRTAPGGAPAPVHPQDLPTGDGVPADEEPF